MFDIGAVEKSIVAVLLEDVLHYIVMLTSSRGVKTAHDFTRRSGSSSSRATRICRDNTDEDKYVCSVMIEASTSPTDEY